MRAYIHTMHLVILNNNILLIQGSKLALNEPLSVVLICKSKELSLMHANRIFPSCRMIKSMTEYSRDNGTLVRFRPHSLEIPERCFLPTAEGWEEATSRGPLAWQLALLPNGAYIHVAQGEPRAPLCQSIKSDKSI